jgi:hypothetical protein
MNLIKHRPEISENNISNLRRVQYEQIPEVFATGLNYLKNFGLEVNSIEIKESRPISYQGINGFELKNYNVFINDGKRPFIRVSFPELIDECFFHIKGVKYMPVLYVIDAPIFKKEIKKTKATSYKKVHIHSYMKPITLFFDQTTSKVIFNRISFDFSLFMSLFFPKEMVKNLCNLMGILYADGNYSAFNSLCKTSTSQKPEYIASLIKRMFYDDYTKELYKEYYGFNSLEEILKNAVKELFKDDVPINDITKKRIVFAEPLYVPLFKSFASSAEYLINGGNLKSINISTGMKAIVSHFNTEMAGKLQYGSYNSFTGLQLFKSTFNIKTTSRLPKQISDISPSYKNVICPITISNKDIGYSNTFVPTLEFRSLKYGIIDYGN